MAQQGRPTARSCAASWRGRCAALVALLCFPAFADCSAPSPACGPDKAEEMPLPAWQPRTPSAVLRRSVSHWGDTLLLDRLLEKVVVRREPITVVAIGSSCLSEFGGRKGPQLQLLNLDAFDFVRVVNPDGWLTTGLDWLTSAYPPRKNMSWQGTNFSYAKTETDPVGVEQPYWLINLAIGAVGPMPWGQCLGAAYFQRLPANVDLVIIEWALAASYDKISVDLEKVLQKLLRLWKVPPAFLFVNFFFWCRGNLWCREYVTSQKSGMQLLVEGPQLPLTWERIGPFSFSSFDTNMNTGQVTEDEFRVLAQYYGLPMISMRNAFWYLAAEQAPGFGLHDLIAVDDMGLHPGVPLAKSTYGDVMISFFRSAIRRFWRRRRHAQASSSPSDSEAEKIFLRVPEPMFARTYPEQFGKSQSILAACYSYEVWDQTPPTVRHVSGFEFTKDPDSKKPKPGLATWKAGSFVEFVLDTRALGKGLPFASEAEAQAAKAVVEVRFLVSYARMGKGRLECIEGCSCVGGVMDGTITQQWSVPEVQKFEVSQSATCIVKITSEPGGGGEKFKLLSLSVSFLRQ